MRIFHLSWPFWKHAENSIRGIKTAWRRHFDAIDLDILITKDGVIVCCHWMQPLRRDNFYDPSHRLGVHAMVKEHTWEELRGLRTKDDNYRIIRIERALRLCKRYNIIAYFEPKNDKRFEEDWPWQHIVEYAKSIRYKRRVWVRSIRNFPTKGAGVRRVQAAIRNGIPRRHTSIIN